MKLPSIDNHCYTLMAVRAGVNVFYSGLYVQTKLYDSHTF